jgi:hypothetical protein
MRAWIAVIGDLAGGMGDPVGSMTIWGTVGRCGG